MLVELAESVDLPPFSDSPATFITQTRAMAYLSASVHAFAQKHRAFGLLATTGTINAVSGTKAYALPTDFAALISIMTTVQGQPFKLERMDIDDIDLQPTNGTGWQSYQAGYAILGEQLIVTDPKAAYTLTLRYVPELPMFNTGGAAIADFSATTDYILAKGSIDQWVVLDSAIKCMRKQEKDPSAFVRGREEIEERLLDNLRDRNEHDASSVRETYDRGGGEYNDLWGRW